MVDSVGEAEVTVVLNFDDADLDVPLSDGASSLQSAFTEASGEGYGAFNGVEIMAKRRVPKGQERQDFGPLYEGNGIRVLAGSFQSTRCYQKGSLSLDREGAESFLSSVGVSVPTNG